MGAGRYAPTPSGRMHLGNLMCSLLAWCSAKANGDQVILRIEDLDPERCTSAYAQQILADLCWLGIPPDTGGDLESAENSCWQSRRAGIYQIYYDRLVKMGLVYPCFCTRSQLHAANAPHREDGQVVYPGTCRGLSAQEVSARAAKRPPAWRLRVPDENVSFVDGHMGPYSENLETDCGDFVLRRFDGVFAYQLAVVVDDALMGVTQVVRGSDLLASTPRQLYLYRLLGFTPPRFYHIPLLLAPDGRRLSKRDGDVSLETLRGKYSAPEVVGRLAFLCGLQQTPAPCTPQSLLGDFSWDRVPRQDICIPRGLF